MHNNNNIILHINNKVNQYIYFRKICRDSYSAFNHNIFSKLYKSTDKLGQTTYLILNVSPYKYQIY